MSELGAWLEGAQRQVDTAETVLHEVSRGLGAVNRVEHAVERARPVVRIVVALVVGGLSGVAVYLWVLRPAWQRRRLEAEPGSQAGIADLRSGPPTAEGGEPRGSSGSGAQL